MPQCAITVRGDDCGSAEILSLTTGVAKSETVAEAIEGPITASVTASCPQTGSRGDVCDRRCGGGAI